MKPSHPAAKAVHHLRLFADNIPSSKVVHAVTLRAVADCVVVGGATLSLRMELVRWLQGFSTVCDDATREAALEAAHYLQYGDAVKREPGTPFVDVTDPG